MATPPYPSYDKGGEPSCSSARLRAASPSLWRWCPPPAAPYYQPQPSTAAAWKQAAAKPKTSHGCSARLVALGATWLKDSIPFATEASSVYSRSVHGDIVSQLVSGTTIILISRMSGRSLEIVQGPDGRLMLDAACQTRRIRPPPSSRFKLHQMEHFLLLESSITPGPIRGGH
uniref:POP4 domain-containing protein n=1 Tax=Macrostomum lignano TaxID=282301 RepID=A0A1I8FQS6_9PLAT